MSADDAFWSAIGLPPPTGDHVLAVNARRRDAFARAALSCDRSARYLDCADAARVCFDLADAMLAEADRRLLRDIAALKEKPQQ